jgi:hypothetical protein
MPQKDDSAAAASFRPSGFGLPDPPDVTRISPTVLPVASQDTPVTVSGDGFWNTCSQGLVNGQARATEINSIDSLRITVTAADLASAGQLQIAVRNTQTSNSVPLTVK